MKRKVKVTKVPKYGYGHTGDQQNFGLYRGGGNLQDYLQGSEDAPNDEDIRTYYPEEKKEENANVEVERGELIKDSKYLYKVGGEKHSKGGTKVNVEPGAYVFSDYIVMEPALREAFNFGGTSKKKKENTIAALLSKKVDVKDYNRNKEIIEKAQLGSEVDQYSLNTAVNRLPDYDKYISRAALAGELSKGMQGKPFEIPAIGIPALQALMGGDDRQDSIAETPMTEMMYGGVQKMQDGGSRKIKRSELATFLKQNPDYKQDPNNPNRYVKAGTEGRTEQRKIRVTGAPQNIEVRQAIPGGKAGSSWENWLIGQLQKGVTIDELVKKGHGTKEGLEKYKKYYVAIPGPEQEKVEDVVIAPTPGDEITVEDTSTTERTTRPPGGATIMTTTPTTPASRYFKQDVINLADALTDYSIDFLPTRYSVPGTYIDPAFLRPDYAPIQSAMATAAREVSMYGRAPQVQASVLSNILSTGLPQLNELQKAVGAQNIQTDMAARQFNAQMAQQTALQNAQLQSRYEDQMAQFVQNKNISKLRKKKNVKNALNQMITNTGGASLFNQMFPQAAFDPWTYTLYQKPGSGKLAAEVFGTSGSSGSNMQGIIKAIEDEVTKANLPSEEAKKIYRQGLMSYYIPNMRSTSSRSMMGMNPYMNPYAMGMMGANPWMAGMNPAMMMGMIPSEDDE
jgi:hypothetical protein